MKFKKKSYFIFSSYCPLQICPLKTCNPDISKIIMVARSFTFGQRIQDGESDKLMVGGIVFHKHNFYFFFIPHPLDESVIYVEFVKVILKP